MKEIEFVVPDSLEELDNYLQQREACETGIFPGAEKVIYWHNNKRCQSRLALVYVHGYSASRQETAPLAENLAAALGANLFCTRLAGHGKGGGDAMLQGTVKRWQEDMAEAYTIGAMLGQRVIILAVSTGASLATWFAACKQPVRLEALIFISPNFGLLQKSVYWLDRIGNVGLALLEGLGLGTYRWTPSNERHARYWSHSYPIRALVEMVRLTKMMPKLPIESLQTPLQVILSPRDSVVDPAATEVIFKRWGSEKKQLVPFLTSQVSNQHVLAGAILAPESTGKITQLMLDFIVSLPGQRDAKLNPGACKV